MIRGSSGSGKSDLALRAIAAVPGKLLPRPAVLVADDQVLLKALDGALWVSSPDVLRGLLEVRGLGIVSVEAVDTARLVLVADLVNGGHVERMPEADHAEVQPGWHVPRVRIAPFEASAAVKLLLALNRVEA